MSLPRKRESTIADFLDSRFRGNDANRCPLGGGQESGNPVIAALRIPGCRLRACP